METNIKVQYDPEFAEKIPYHRTLLIEADVRNLETSSEQIEEMKRLAAEIEGRYEIGQINSNPCIAATRVAYKICGKDPNRYRPSQEQLMRRIVRGLGLYYVNALVDAGNQLSLMTGCSVGCFDADKVVGSVITLGIGKENEPYEGIGRGELNIAGLPVFRDDIGGIGTPTSDNERTKLSLGTERLLVTVHLFDKSVDADSVFELFKSVFVRFGNAVNIRHSLFRATD